jgi:hypothetical protein
VGEEVVRGTIYRAMQQTYAWMKGFMQPRLKDALGGIEMKYYNNLAEQGTLPERLTSAHMTKVFTAAVTHNEREMAKGGWI